MADINKETTNGNDSSNQMQTTAGVENTVNVKMLFNKFFIRYWYLYVYTITLSMITAYFYNWYATPIYFTSCTVIIKDQKKANSTDLLSQIGAYDDEGGIDNEIGIIRSRQLIYKSLFELGYDHSYLLKGDIKTQELYNYSPISFIGDTLFPLAKKTAINIKIIDDKKVQVSYTKNGKTIAGTYAFDARISNKLGVFIIQKTALFNDALYRRKSFEKRNFIVRFGSLDNLTDNYQTALKVDRVSKAASILQISLQGPLPSKNEDFLNKLCELYIKKGIELKNQYAVNTLSFIDEQIALLNLDINSNEENVEAFRLKKGITDIGTEATGYLESVKNFENKIADVQVQVSFLEYLQQYITSGKDLSGNISPASILVNDPLLQNLILKLNDLENKRKAQANVVKQDNPLFVSLQTEIQNTKNALLENVKSIRNGLEASLNEAQLQKGSVQNKLRLLPGAQRELSTLMRGSSIKETLYTYLLQKRAETAILLASTTADNRVVDPARTFPKPLKPVKSLSYSIALLLGLIIPALIIYLRDALNDKIGDRYDLERLTNIPILGMIGLSASKSSLVVTEKPNSHISEAFRSIRTNLQYFTPNKNQNVIMLTSSISSEGKSFCSINLAVMLSLSGRKTILVGCDLRKPKITVGFDFKSEIGLSNYLIGIATEKEIIQNSGSIPNLDIILSGPKPPNPSELIISKRMDEIFVYLKANYDNIILDTPPIGLITDAMVLSKYTDVNIYVVRQSVTRKQHLNFINNLYKEGKIKNLCIILNAMKASNKSYGYGYEYAYGYGYGYGYGYYEDEESTKGLKGAFKSIFNKKKKA